MQSRFPRRRSGLSLVEIIIATAVLAIGILGVMATFIFGTQATGTGKRTSEATNYARMILESIRINPTDVEGSGASLFPSNLTGLNDSEGDRVTLEAAPFNSAGLPTGTSFKRNVQVTYPSAAIAQIRVRVFWTEREHERSVELIALQSDPN